MHYSPIAGYDFTHYLLIIGYAFMHYSLIAGYAFTHDLPLMGWCWIPPLGDALLRPSRDLGNTHPHIFAIEMFPKALCNSLWSRLRPSILKINQFLPYHATVQIIVILQTDQSYIIIKLPDISDNFSGVCKLWQWLLCLMGPVPQRIIRKVAKKVFQLGGSHKVLVRV